MNSEELRYYRMLEEREFLEAKIIDLEEKIDKNHAKIGELIKKLKQKMAELKTIC